MRGSRSTSGFQSLKRRRLFRLSNTMVSLRLVSIFSTRWREDGSTRPMTRYSTATIAREIRISSKRVIQASPGKAAGLRPRRPAILPNSPGRERASRRAKRDGRHTPSPMHGPCSDQLQLERLEHRPGAVAHAELAQDVGDVV